jgi:putative addiction module component (TIGR02574 family)
MNTATLRQKLHDRIDRAGRTELLSLLKIVEDDGGRSSIPEEFLPELERRLADLKSGRTKAISLEESKARLDKMLADAKCR